MSEVRGLKKLVRRGYGYWNCVLNVRVRIRNKGDYGTLPYEFLAGFRHIQTSPTLAAVVLLAFFVLERVKWYAEESVFISYGYRTYRVVRRLARNFLELLAVEVPTDCNALVKLVDF